MLVLGGKVAEANLRTLNGLLSAVPLLCTYITTQ